MNRRIDLSKLGGLPLSQKDLDWLQVSYRDALSAIAGLCGDMVIVSGMLEGGGAVTAGWIAKNGELIPFAAGTIGTGEFSIVESSINRTFFDGNTHAIRFEKTAQFSAGGAFQYSDLKRLDSLKVGMVPTGAIVMWSGAIVSIPTGWLLCDGTLGTPDLSGRFIAGYKDGDPDYGTITDTGGESSVTLAANQQGTFTVRQLRDDISGGGASVTAQLTFNGNALPIDGGSNQSSLGSPLTVNLTAAATAHENRPPYYVLAFIIKQ